MCLMVFAFQPDQPQPLIVASNRDEFYARPAKALHRWPTEPALIAGQDVQAGGTWLGLNTHGRFGALTNIRDLSIAQGPRSRGELVSDFLQSRQSPKAYLEQIAAAVTDYSGFNLLVGDRRALYFLNSQEGVVRQLPPGIYGLSNASLDTPWPKLLRLRDGFSQALKAPTFDGLFALLADPWQPSAEDLPHTGIAQEMEQLLSSVFIESDFYGTRASTVLMVEDTGAYHISEKSFGENGQPLGEVRLSGQFAPSRQYLMQD